VKKNHVTIVTGGTRGIGADISLRLAARGDRVVAVYKSDDQAAEKFEKKIKECSPESCVVQADVSVAKDVDRLVGIVIDNYGNIDILINNAGIFDFRFVEDMDEVFLNRIMDGNFKSQFLMMNHCVKYMKNNAFGRILNASSISGKMADVGLMAYGASKAAVDMMTKICAAEFAPYGITVNAYAPGIVHTDLTDSMIRERGHIQVKQIPLNRFGTSNEVAALVAFLSSEEASYITGEIIGIDGGMLKVQNPYRAHAYVQKSAGDDS